ncbi:serine/threonine protein kinase [Rubinisphaera margarita]|uniref:serine/threonine protein kinase n=1 Tax=Rubinisphaera margarita TaxID=2909586 RepID=UPI001EE94107|nr:protein kinase [Rubinisphaera margarita]MCG6154270.1 protein kinase [Rubinisphaera margarita]
MYDPPSRDLIARLEQYTSCRERDVLRCRAAVHRLATDLPAFDSIWLDALVQRRKLSPYQADCLASGRDAQLRIGNFYVIAPIAGDRVTRRFLGQSATGRQFVLIDQYFAGDHSPSELQDSLTELRRRLGSQSRLASTGAPVEILEHHGSACAIHEYQHGVTIEELLVRRGRFPEPLVRTIAQQLLHHLRTFDQAGLVHGDLRPRNLMLNRRGQLRVMNTGVLPASQPMWTLQTPLPFDAYDHLAPEMIRTGSWTTETDLYAAGCLLWQMACGRPPHYSADPFFKINAHIEQTIPHVHEFAPDIDTETADLIFALTRPDPAERLRVLSGADSRRPGERVTGPQQVARYVRRFEQPRSAIPRTRAELAADYGVLTTVACILCALLWVAGVSVPSTWQMAESLIETPAVEVGTGIESKKDEASHQGDNSKLAELPQPDQRGIIRLTPGTKYRAREIGAVGPLTVVVVDDAKRDDAAPPQPPEIIIGDDPWRIAATEFSLSQVTLRHESPAAGSRPPGALLVCQSSNLRVNSCSFRDEQSDPRTEPADPRPPMRAIAWKPISEDEANSGRIELANCQFLQQGAGLLVAGTAREISLVNCLKVRQGNGIEIICRASRSLPAIRCEQVTLREADNLVYLDCTGYEPAGLIQLDIEATNCVFKFREENSSLVAIASTSSPARNIRAINLLGQMLLVSNPGPTVSWWNPTRKVATPLQTEGVIEGILPYPVEFAGPISNQFRDSELNSYEGPRWNSMMPGIQTATTFAPAESLFR